MRQQEEYIIDQHQGLMGRMLMSQAISKFVPSKGSQFSETLQHSLHNNTLAYMGDIVQRTFGDSTLISKEICYRWLTQREENLGLQLGLGHQLR